jgi:signal transduction histidine kinase
MIGPALCLAAAELTDALDPAANFTPTTVAPALALIIGAWAAGRVLRDRSRMLSALAETAVAIEREHELVVRSARTSERARVARELHDAVARAMTVIVLQAGAARRVWESDQDLAREHTETLRKTVSELITELRATAVALDRATDAGARNLERLIGRPRQPGCTWSAFRLLVFDRTSWAAISRHGGHGVPPGAVGCSHGGSGEADVES